jgi:nucleoside-diphosphate-sugar epimerase
MEQRAVDQAASGYFPALAVGGARLLGKGAMARRLFDDLEVDASAFTKDSGWQPKKSLEDGLREMAAAYAQQHRVGRFA